MKTILTLLFALASNVVDACPLPEITANDELAKHIDKRVVLEGVYRDATKGDRTVECGFGSLRIQDNSFSRLDKNQFLVSELKDGDRIRFEAVLRFFKGSKVRVSRARDIQRSTPPIENIRGRDYYVEPPSYSISDAKLIEIKKAQYKVDLSESRAYLHRDLISIYLVANADNIIQLTVPYSDADMPKTKAAIDRRNITATLYTGPNVKKFVLPAGPAIPQPQYDQKLYSRYTATGGLITYSSTPNGKLPPECNITISADQIEFTDGILYSIEEISLTAYPPPP